MLSPRGGYFEGSETRTDIQNACRHSRVTWPRFSNVSPQRVYFCSTIGTTPWHISTLVVRLSVEVTTHPPEMGPKRKEGMEGDSQEGPAFQRVQRLTVA